MRCTPKWMPKSTSRKPRQRPRSRSRRSRQRSRTAPNASASKGSEIKRLAQKRRTRACAFNRSFATLPMHRWCFSIGNFAKQVWDQGCAEPQASPMPASSSHRAAGTLGGKSLLQGESVRLGPGAPFFKRAKNGPELGLGSGLSGVKCTERASPPNLRNDSRTPVMLATRIPDGIRPSPPNQTRAAWLTPTTRQNLCRRSTNAQAWHRQPSTRRQWPGVPRSNPWAQD